MSSDEVHAAERCFGRAIDHFTATDDGGENAHFSIGSFDESSDHIPIAAVPLAPMSPFGKGTELVKAGGIPRLGDEFSLADDGI